MCDIKLKSKIKLRKRIVYTDTARIECFYLFDYDKGIVGRFLYALKRSADKDLFEYASTLYCRCFPENFEGVVSFTPRKHANIRNFGYDQVHKSCKNAAEKCGFQFVKLVARRGLSRDQKNLNLVQRQKNVHGKFRVIKKDIPGNILLADDVLTTGSTFKECANVLLRQNPNVKITGIFLASRNLVGSSGE